MSLDSLYIFCPRLSKSESDEENKVLYFYPQNTPLMVQLKFVALAQGASQFIHPFSESSPLDTIMMEKKALFLLTPEDGIWMCVVLNNACISSGKTQVYDEETWDKRTILRVLKILYNHFKILYGSMNAFIDSGKIETLKSIINEQITKAIKTISWNQLDIFTTLGGIHFYPTTRTVFLAVQQFVCNLEDAFKPTYATMVFCASRIVWSGLEHDDTNAFYTFFSNTYVYNDKNTIKEGDTTFISVNSVFISDKEVQLLIAKRNEMTCVVFVEKGFDVNPLKSYLEKEMQKLSCPSIDEQKNDDEYEYIYYNRMNLAIKSTIKQKLNEIDKTVMKLLLLMHAEFEDNEDCNELIVKTENDKWVVGRKVNEREIYVLFSKQSEWEITDVVNEVAKLYNDQFKNIFLY